MTDLLLKLIDESQPAITEAEERGHFDATLFNRIAEIGFFDLTRPQTYGGQQVDYEDLLQLILAVSGRNGSLGWCLMILGQHNILAQGYPESVTSRLFKERPLLLTTCFTPVGHAIRLDDGGYRLTGTWHYATSIHYCNWVAVDAQLDDSDQAATFLVPARLFTIHDDWRMIGMRATGSPSISLEALESDEIMMIPPEHKGFLAPHSRERIPPAYRIPQRIMTALGTLAPIVGMLEGLVDISAGRMKRPGARAGIDMETLALHEAMQSLRGEVAQCDVLFRSLAAAVTRLTRRNDEFPGATQDDIVLQCGLLADRCRGLASRAFALSGTAAARQGNPIGTRLCDIHVMASHYLLRRPILSMNAALRSLSH